MKLPVFHNVLITQNLTWDSQNAFSQLVSISTSSDSMLLYMSNRGSKQGQDRKR